VYAVIYIRVSSVEQVSNMSLAVQERACRDYCDKNDLQVIKVYREEGESAKTADRPELQKMLAEITRRASEVEFLVVYDLSRLTRNTYDHLAIRNQLDSKGIKLRAATQTLEESAEGEFVQTVLAATNKLDNDIRKRKSIAGMKEGLERGKWQWQAPLGFRHRVSEDGKRRWIELDPDIAPLLVVAFRKMAAEVASVEDLLRELNEKGTTAARGRKLSAATLHRILRNPFYAGRIVSKRWGVETKGEHPALIDELTFERVRRVLHNGQARAYRTETADFFPLRQIMLCECGRAMSGGFSVGRGRKRYGYYVCRPCGVNVPDKAAEGELLAALDRLSGSPEAVAEFRRQWSLVVDARADESKKATDAALRKLNAAEARLERIRGLLIDGSLDPQEFAQEKAATMDAKRRAELAIDAAKVPDSIFDEVLRRGEALLTRPATVFDALPRRSRAPFLRAAFPGGFTWIPSRSEIRTVPSPLFPKALEALAEPDLTSGTGNERLSETLTARVVALRAILLSVEGIEEALDSARSYEGPDRANDPTPWTTDL
jgi:DNA invertase Pin-like site-specific DNA recombinase